MKSVFPPARTDARPVLLVLLVTVVLFWAMNQTYLAGVAAGPVLVIQDSIPLAPDSLLCLQWKWINEQK